MIQILSLSAHPKRGASPLRKLLISKIFDFSTSKASRKTLIIKGGYHRYLERVGIFTQSVIFLCLLDSFVSAWSAPLSRGIAIIFAMLQLI